MKRNIPKLIRNSQGEMLDFTYHPGAPELSTLVILGHGVTGNKDRPLLIELANLLSRTGIHCVRFDMFRIYSVRNPAWRVNVPHLFVHGLEDDVVPPQDSRDLYAMAAEPRRLVEIPEADHVFSGEHAAAMASAVVAWMRHLKL